MGDYQPFYYEFYSISKISINAKFIIGPI